MTKLVFTLAGIVMLTLTIPVSASDVPIVTNAVAAEQAFNFAANAANVYTSRPSCDIPPAPALCSDKEIAREIRAATIEANSALEMAKQDERMIGRAWLAIDAFNRLTPGFFR